MYEETTGKSLRQVEHISIRGHLWHRYSVTVKINNIISEFEHQILQWPRLSDPFIIILTLKYI
jgi:hypothetical protein